jgi:hypothetical protein
LDADIRPLTRTGNVSWRSDFIEAAERVRVRHPHFQAFYEKKYGEARHHAHKRQGFGIVPETRGTD